MAMSVARSNPYPTKCSRGKPAPWTARPIFSVVAVYTSKERSESRSNPSPVDIRVSVSVIPLCSSIVRGLLRRQVPTMSGRLLANPWLFQSLRFHFAEFTYTSGHCNTKTRHQHQRAQPKKIYVGFFQCLDNYPILLTSI